MTLPQGPREAWSNASKSSSGLGFFLNQFHLAWDRPSVTGMTNAVLDMVARKATTVLIVIPDGQLGSGSPSKARRKNTRATREAMLSTQQMSSCHQPFRIRFANPLRWLRVLSLPPEGGALYGYSDSC